MLGQGSVSSPHTCTGARTNTPAHPPTRSQANHTCAPTRTNTLPYIDAPHTCIRAPTHQCAADDDVEWVAHAHHVPWLALRQPRRALGHHPAAGKGRRRLPGAEAKLGAGRSGWVMGGWVGRLGAALPWCTEPSAPSMQQWWRQQQE